jgi:hypothetical protein
METLKKPETIATGVTAVGLIGLAWYTITKLNELTNEVETLAANVEEIGKKFSELRLTDYPSTKTNVDQTLEAFKRVDAVLKQMNGRINDIQETSEADNEQIQEFCDSVKESILAIDNKADIYTIELVEPPPPPPRRGRASRGKHGNVREQITPQKGRKNDPVRGDMNSSNSRKLAPPQPESSDEEDPKAQVEAFRRSKGR